jgi:hypothetical protein
VSAPQAHLADGGCQGNELSRETQISLGPPALESTQPFGYLAEGLAYLTAQTDHFTADASYVAADSGEPIVQLVSNAFQDLDGGVRRLHDLFPLDDATAPEQGRGRLASSR